MKLFTTSYSILFNVKDLIDKLIEIIVFITQSLINVLVNNGSLWDPDVNKHENTFWNTILRNKMPFKKVFLVIQNLNAIEWDPKEICLIANFGL